MDGTQSTYISLFSEEKSKMLKELLNSCIDEICGHPGPSYYKFVKTVGWTKEEYDTVYKLISLLLRNPASLYLIEEKMPQEYHELPEHVQLNLLTCLKIRREQLLKALIKENSKRKRDTLIDFDWRIKLIMGSSKMASLREPLLQLDLILEDKENQHIKCIELDKDELEIIINTLNSSIS
ncbi:COMM domain-containing protein 8-like [Prorops nasuta]|uniref:COMM domain-containing protein 8-like n=1 Tax=Prorops nasuta TaxID=863751 RepID=UPI0034CFEB08